MTEGEATVYPVDMKVEEDSKGNLKPVIHIYGHDDDEVRTRLVTALKKLKADIAGLQAGG